MTTSGKVLTALGVIAAAGAVAYYVSTRVTVPTGGSTTGTTGNTNATDTTGNSLSSLINQLLKSVGGSKSSGGSIGGGSGGGSGGGGSGGGGGLKPRGGDNEDDTVNPSPVSTPLGGDDYGGRGSTTPSSYISGITPSSGLAGSVVSAVSSFPLSSFDDSTLDFDY